MHTYMQPYAKMGGKTGFSHPRMGGSASSKWTPISLQPVFSKFYYFQLTAHEVSCHNSHLNPPPVIYRQQAWHISSHHNKKVGEKDNWRCYSLADCLCIWATWTCTLAVSEVLLSAPSHLFFSFSCCGVHDNLDLALFVGARGLISLFSTWFLLFSCKQRQQHTGHSQNLTQNTANKTISWTRSIHSVRTFLVFIHYRTSVSWCSREWREQTGVEDLIGTTSPNGARHHSRSWAKQPQTESVGIIWWRWRQTPTGAEPMVLDEYDDYRTCK